jgi:hypothetical protein
MEWSTSVKNSVGFLVQVEQDLHATVRSSHFAQAAHDELCRSAVAARDCALSLRLQARSEMTRLECESLSQLERAVHERNAHAAAWRASNQLQLNQARAEEEKLAAQLSEMRGSLPTPSNCSAFVPSELPPAARAPSSPPLTPRPALRRGVEAACQALAAMESRLQIAELPATPDARVWDEPAQDGALAAEVMSALHAVPGVEDGGVSMRTLAIELQYNVRLADALRLRTPVDRERFLSRVHDLVRARRNEHEQSWAGAGGAAIDDLVDVRPPAPSRSLLRSQRVLPAGARADPRPRERDGRTTCSADQPNDAPGPRPAQSNHAAGLTAGARARGRAAPPPPLRTNRTRRVLHPVLIGHATSLTPY